MDGTQKTIATYDKIAEQYANRWQDTFLHDEIERFLSYIKPRKMLLDLGCGFGRDMLEFARRGYSVVGVDRSAGMLKVAAERGAKMLVHADMRRLPFAHHHFSGIWANASLLHLPKSDLLSTLKELNAILEHGHLYLSVKKGDDEVLHGENGQERFFAYYHPAEIELAMERADFHVLNIHITPDSEGRDLAWINAIGWTKLETPKVGASAVIFNDAGQVLLTRRSDNGLWCVPGGHMDMDETIQRTAIREAKEETGLDVEIEQLSGMYNVQYPADYFPERKKRPVFVVTFRCKVIGGELTLNDEVTEFGWFDPQDLPDDLLLYQDQRVNDALKLKK